MKNGLLLAMLLGLGTAVTAQTLPTVSHMDELVDRKYRAAVRYYDRNWLPLPGGPAGAYGYDRIERHDSASISWRTRRYVLATGRLVLQQFWKGEAPGYVLEGGSREWYESGQLKEEVQYRDGQLVGELRTYYASGQRRRVQSFGVITGNSYCYDASGKARPSCPPYHKFAKLLVRGYGTEQYMALVQSLYAKALPAGYRQPEELRVYYAFRVDSTGQVRDGRVLNAYPGWDKAAVAPALEAAILQAIGRLVFAGPATVEGEATNDLIEGIVQAKRVRR